MTPDTPEQPFTPEELADDVLMGFVAPRALATIRHLQSQVEAARAGAWEVAAKVAENEYQGKSATLLIAGQRIASAIRALIPPVSGGETA